VRSTHLLACDSRQACVDRRPCQLMCRIVGTEHSSVVRSPDQRVQLECELGGCHNGCDLTELPGLLDRAFQLTDPGLVRGDDGVAHRPRSGADLRAHLAEDAAYGNHESSGLVEPAEVHPFHPTKPQRRGEGRQDHLDREDLGCSLNSGELQVCLRAEEREEPLVLIFSSSPRRPMDTPSRPSVEAMDRGRCRIAWRLRSPRSMRLSARGRPSRPAGNDAISPSSICVRIFLAFAASEQPGHVTRSQQHVIPFKNRKREIR
jgi:hypothetical protein